MRDNWIDVSFESEGQSNTSYYAGIVKVLDMLMAVLTRKAAYRNKAKL